MDKRQQLFALWYFIVILIYFVISQSFLIAPHVSAAGLQRVQSPVADWQHCPSHPRDAYVQGALRTEGIERVLPQDKVARIVKTTGKDDTSGLYPFTAVRIDDPTLVQEMEAAKVPYTGQVENTWFAALLSGVLPVLLFFSVWALMRVWARKRANEYRQE